MRSDIPALLVAASASFLVSGYAYMVGMLLPYGVENLGVLGIDDVLAASAWALALTAALLIPLVVALFRMAPVGGTRGRYTLSRPAQVSGLIIVVVLLLIEVGASTGAIQIYPPVSKSVVPVAAGVIATFGFGSGSATGRIAAALLVAVLLAYQMGVHARIERPGERPVSVLLTDGEALCGDLLATSPSGLFVVEADKVLSFVQTGAYRIWSRRKCQPHEATVTLSSPEPR